MPRQRHRLHTWDKLTLYTLDELTGNDDDRNCVRWFNVRQIVNAARQHLNGTIALRISLSQRSFKRVENSVRACLNNLAKAEVVLKTRHEFPTNRLSRYSRMYNCYSFPSYPVVNKLRRALRDEVANFRCLDYYNIGTQTAYNEVIDWWSEPIRLRQWREQLVNECNQALNGFHELSQRSAARHTLPSCSAHSLEEIYIERQKAALKKGDT